MNAKERRRGRRRFGAVVAERGGLFTVRWMEGGRRRGRRGFSTRSAADAFLARVRVALADGVLEAERRADVTLASVAHEWLEVHSAVKLRGHRHNVARWREIEDFFGGVTRLAEVSPTRILQFREALARRGVKPATTNRYLALFRTVLAFAVTTGHIQVSPVRRFGRGGYLLPEVRPKRSPPLQSGAEALRLLEVIRARAPEWHALFVFLLLTGARRGEAAGLRWDDVDLTRRLATIRRSYDAPPKSGRERTVPLSAELVGVLTEHRMRSGRATQLVFPNPRDGQMLPVNAKLGGILDDACKVAGLARLRVHDLRHAHAGLWLMAGGAIADVQKNLGHSTPVLTIETYGHIAEDHRIHEADNRLALGMPKAGLRAVAGEG